MAFIGKGGQVTELNASNLSTGTVPVARLGSGTADSTTFLRGDNTWGVVQTSVAPDVQTFNSNGTWTKPTGGQTMARIQAWGGGGGGTGVDARPGSAGGGGGYNERWMRLSELPASVSVIVGAGGAGVLTNSGGTGGTSSFGTYVYAYGGGGGGSYPLTGAWSSGAGGSQLSAGPTGGGNTYLANPGASRFWDGGAGGYHEQLYQGTILVKPLSSVYGGGGGGTQYGGSAVAGAASVYGGAGGLPSGGTGSVPGGGGGAYAFYYAGAGGAGRVIVTSF